MIKIDCIVVQVNDCACVTHAEVVADFETIVQLACVARDGGTVHFVSEARHIKQWAVRHGFDYMVTATHVAVGGIGDSRVLMAEDLVNDKSLTVSDGKA